MAVGAAQEGLQAALQPREVEVLVEVQVRLGPVGARPVDGTAEVVDVDQRRRAAQPADLLGQEASEGRLAAAVDAVDAEDASGHGAKGLASAQSASWHRPLVARLPRGWRTSGWL